MKRTAEEAVLHIPRPRRAPIDRPTVLANFAVTWDARISTRNHTPADFSPPLDKRRLLAVRAVADAVMAGHGTVRADNMSMGLSEEALREAREARGQRAYPARVIFSNSGQVDPELKVFQHDFSPIVIFSTEKMPAKTRAALSPRAKLHLYDAGKTDLADALRVLRRDYGVKSLVCEGGAALFHSLLAQELVDDLFLTWCPRIFGGKEAPAITGPAGDFLPTSVEAKLLRMIPHEGACYAHYRLGPAAKPIRPAP